MAPRLVSEGIEELVGMDRTGDPAAHVSKIIGSLCIQLGHFEESDLELMTPTERGDLQTRWELGSAFEKSVIRSLAERHALKYPDRFVIPGELERDGIIGSPDLLDVVDSAVTEIKLTWMSSRHDAESEKFWKYWVQAKAYAHMMDWDVCRLHVCHINGDYKDRRGPIYRVYEEQFSQRQLLENWTMLTNHMQREARRARLAN